VQANAYWHNLLYYTVKKVSDFPSPAGIIIKLFPARKSLVSDFPAGDGKIASYK
jgi:hypothetical protein